MFIYYVESKEARNDFPSMIMINRFQQSGDELKYTY